MNLIGNAIKHGRRSGQPGRVVLRSLGPEDATWHFAVSDDGPGIAAEFHERIFGMFQRLHARESYPGTGIGLAIARKVVEHHGGRIWAEPRPEGGTRMAFTLPADGSAI
jgi:signal transduction histidine kinase